jgi:hypothetical protein
VLWERPVLEAIDLILYDETLFSVGVVTVVSYSFPACQVVAAKVVEYFERMPSGYDPGRLGSEQYLETDIYF